MNTCCLIFSASVIVLVSIAAVPFLSNTNSSSFLSGFFNIFHEKPAVEGADLIVANGTIFTSDASLPFAESMAIRKGRIIRVGSYASLQEMSRSGTKMLDLEGKIVVPGFIDSHVHLIPGGLQRRFLALKRRLRFSSPRCFADALRFDKYAPMEFNIKLGEDTGEAPVNRERFQRLVGRLIYLAHTRPDIAYAVSSISQFMHSPNQKHLDAAHRILRFLKDAPGKGLLFQKTEKRGIEAYTDADWGSCVKTRRSVTGYCTFVWGNLVTWRSKKQNVVSRSSSESELRAMAQGVCEAMWIRRVLQDLKVQCSMPLKLFCDNEGAIDIVNEPVQHDRTKHVDIDTHFIKEKMEEGTLCIPFLPSPKQTADGLTKALMKTDFQKFVSKLGMKDIHALT